MKKKENLLLLILSIVLMLIPVSHVGIRPIPYIYNDEFGYWATAAYLRGYSWEKVISEISYYSYGYGIILAPLLYMFEDTSNAYNCALALNALWLCGSFWCLIYIANKIGYEKKYEVYITSFCVALYANNIAQSYYTWPEVFLFLLFCVITCILYSICEKATVIKCILVGLLCVYSYAVHQRTLGIVISVILVMLILMMTKKIQIKHFGGFILTFIVIMIVSLIMKDNIISDIWNRSSTVNSNNLSGQVSKIESLISLEGLKNLILSICGKLFYLSIATSFLVFFALEKIVTNIVSAVRGIGQKKISSFCVMNIFYLMVFVFEFMISSIFMIHPRGATHVVYGRYMENILGPFLLIGIGRFYEVISKKRLAGYLFITLLCGCGVLCSIKKFELNGYASINDTMLTKFVSPNNVEVLHAFFWGSVFLVGIYYCRKFHYFKMQDKVLVPIFLSIVWIYMGIGAADTFNNWYYKDAPREIEACVKEVKENEKERGINNTHIYILKSNAGYHKKYMGNGIQFLLPSYDVQYIECDEVATIDDKMHYVLSTAEVSEIEGYHVIYRGELYNIFIRDDNL